MCYYVLLWVVDAVDVLELKNGPKKLQWSDKDRTKDWASQWEHYKNIVVVLFCFLQ